MDETRKTGFLTYGCVLCGKMREPVLEELDVGQKHGTPKIGCPGKWFSLGLTNLLSISWIALTRGAGILVLIS